MRERYALQFSKNDQRLGICAPAGFNQWLEPAAHCRAFGHAEQLAAVVIGELSAAHPSRFALGHTWNG